MSLCPKTENAHLRTVFAGMLKEIIETKNPRIMTDCNMYNIFASKSTTNSVRYHFRNMGQFGEIEKILQTKSFLTARDRYQLHFH